VALHELPLAAMQEVEPKITADALKVLSVESSVKSRTSFGGTAPKNVMAQAKAWAKRLEKERCFKATAQHQAVAAGLNPPTADVIEAIRGRPVQEGLA
jgi:hypothetical protein